MPRLCPFLSDDSGGGIFDNPGATASVTRSNFLDNSAAIYGGGIFNYGDLTVTATTLADNSSAADGGAICNFGTLSVDTSQFFSNSPDAIANFDSSSDLGGNGFS